MQEPLSTLKMLASVCAEPYICSHSIESDTEAQSLELTMSTEDAKEKSESKKDAPNLFSASTVVLSVAAIYVYFSGYFYSFFFYRAFGVALESLDLSTQFYFVQAYHPIGTLRGLLLLCLLILFITGYLRQLFGMAWMVVVMLALFPFLLSLSRSVAIATFSETRCKPSIAIRLQIKEAAGKPTEVVNREMDPANNFPCAQLKDETDKKTCIERKALYAAAVPTARATPTATSIVTSIPSDTPTLKELAAMGDKDQLFLLVETKDRIVLYGKANCFAGVKSAPAVHVYTLLRSDLNYSMVVVP